MFLNNDFMKLWEELSELNESKADTQKLINFAGEDLAKRFLAIKNRLKAPKNDLYYWINTKTVDELEQIVLYSENAKSKSRVKKEVADQGAKLIQETEHWKVYHITTYEAAKKYGKDTKWCITGLEGAFGDRYWHNYKSIGTEFYFLITKMNYDPRGLESKFAIAIVDEYEAYEAYNQQDASKELFEIPYINEISIPNVNFNELDYTDLAELLENEFADEEDYEE